MTDLISRADAIEAVCGDCTIGETIKWLESLKTEIGKPEHRTLWHYAESIDMAIEALSEPKMAEEVREALMRLAMCAREECGMCKYKDECGFDFQYKISTDNMNTLANALLRSKCEVDAKSAEAVQGWIPCSERLPEDIRPVLVTWKNIDPASYYQYIVGKHFIGTAHYYRGKWYWYSSVTEDLLAEYGKCDTEEFDEAIECIAWMPLPTPYKGGEDNNA